MQRLHSQRPAKLSDGLPARSLLLVLKLTDGSLACTYSLCESSLGEPFCDPGGPQAGQK